MPRRFGLSRRGRRAERPWAGRPPLPSYDDVEAMSQLPDDDPARVLSQVPLFGGLDRVTFAKLAARFERVRFGPGELVFQEGDPGDAFYVVLRGTFSDFVGAPDTGGDTRARPEAQGRRSGRSPSSRTGLARPRPGPTPQPRRSGSSAADSSSWWPRSRRWRSRSRRPSASACGSRTSAGWAPWKAGTPGQWPAPFAVRDPALGSDAGGRVRSRRRRIVGGGLAALLLVATWATPPPAGLEPAGWRALGTLAPVPCSRSRWSRRGSSRWW